MSDDLCTCNTCQDTLSKMASAMRTSVPVDETIFFALASYVDIVIAVVIPVIVLTVAAIIFVLMVPLVSARTVNLASPAFVVIVLLRAWSSHLTVLYSLSAFIDFVGRLRWSDDDLLLRCRNEDGFRSL